MNNLESAVVEHVRTAALSDRYAAYLRNTLVELAAIDTGPGGEDSAGRRKGLFDWVANEARAILGDNAAVEHKALGPDGRHGGQLKVLLPGQAEPATIIQACVDAGSPWFAPRAAGERVFGCGVSQNKGQTAVLLAQMKLMMELFDRLGLVPSHACACQFVSGTARTENPSNVAANLPVLVLDCTDRAPCCGQHGLVQYRARLTVPEGAGFSAVELFPLVVLGLEKEGRRIGREELAPAFRADRVRANVGLLGGFGSDVAVACDHVAVEIEVYARAKPDRIAMIVTQLLDSAMVPYTEKHGDRTREIDPVTGRPMLDRHFTVDLETTPEASVVRIDVRGCPGHMASGSGDNAIGKAAFLLGALLRMAPKYPNVRATARLAQDPSSAGEIVLAGAQSFALPLTAGDVQQRLTAAATDGLQKYCQLRGCRFNPGMIDMTFDSVVGEAYAGASDNMPMRALRAAFDALNEPCPEPAAWLGNGDAALYHSQGHPVATFGAGKLDAAYGPNEHVDIPDLQKALAVSTLAAWSMMG